MEIGDKVKVICIGSDLRLQCLLNQTGIIIDKTNEYYPKFFLRFDDEKVELQHIAIEGGIWWGNGGISMLKKL